MGERSGGICLFVCLGQVQGHFLLAYGQDATGNRKRVLREDAGLEVGSYVTLGWVPSLSPFSKRGKTSLAGLWEKTQVPCLVHRESSIGARGL